MLSENIVDIICKPKELVSATFELEAVTKLTDVKRPSLLVLPFHQLLKKLLVALHGAQQCSHNKLTTGPGLLMSKDIIQLKENTNQVFIDFINDITN